MRNALKSIAGIVLAISFLSLVVSLLVVVTSLFNGHFGDVPASAALILGSSIGAIISAGILWLLVDIANAVAPEGTAKGIANRVTNR